MRLNASLKTRRGIFLGAGCALLLAAAPSQAALVISTGRTQNVHCSAGVCKERASDAVLNVADLASMLSNGDVKIATGKVAKDIVFEAALSWANASRLTVDAYGGITVSQPISITGTGGLRLATNSGGGGGDYSFTDKGHIGFWDLRSKLAINGASYRLVSGVSGLAEAIRKEPSGNYALAAEYDAAQDGTYSSAPILTAVRGNVEGLGNTVAHLTIDDLSTAKNTETALFSSNSGTIRDFEISGLQATGGYEGFLGGFVGVNSGLIQNVSVTGSLMGGRYTFEVGGVIGLNNGNSNRKTALVQNVSFVGKVSASGDAGGIAGENYYGLVSGAYGGGAVEGSAAGGVVGSNWGGAINFSHSDSSIYSHIEQASLGGLAGLSTGPISHCFATGPISNTGDFGGSNGGLVGESSGTINASYATGSVTGIGANGGLAGRSNNAAITNVYATGAVMHGSSIGGLVGASDGSPVDGAYSTGAVTFGSGYVGGAIGSGGSPNDVYWDLNTSQVSNPTRGCGNMPNCPGVTGVSDAQLKSAMPAGFDSSVWAEDPNVNGGYPYLKRLPTPGSPGVKSPVRLFHADRAS